MSTRCTVSLRCSPAPKTRSSRSVTICTGQPAILYFDRRTCQAVVQKPTGEFWSGWRLSPKQLEHVITTGKLGGG
ncbi:colicin D domain-containing protein [Saccharopolyspora phatthalungensis]|uniref:colicin D domain-containing protein n=1 Tax=Saccharopolyspora phatthalungensis TaxID=664693 RepID=UPI0035E418C2